MAAGSLSSKQNRLGGRPAAASVSKRERRVPAALQRLLRDVDREEQRRARESPAHAAAALRPRRSSTHRSSAGSRPYWPHASRNLSGATTSPAALRRRTSSSKPAISPVRSQADDRLRVELELIRRQRVAKLDGSDRLASRGRRQRRELVDGRDARAAVAPWRACTRARPPRARAAIARRPGRRRARRSPTPARRRCRSGNRAGSPRRESSAASSLPARPCVPAARRRSDRREAADQGVRAGSLLDQRADALNHLVAGAQAERFVDRLELVDVDVQHRASRHGRAPVARAARRSSRFGSPVSESYSLSRMATALRLTNSRIRTSRGSKSSASADRNSATSPSTPPFGSRNGHERILYGAPRPGAIDDHRRDC